MKVDEYNTKKPATFNDVWKGSTLDYNMWCCVPSSLTEKKNKMAEELQQWDLKCTQC